MAQSPHRLACAASLTLLIAAGPLSAAPPETPAAPTTPSNLAAGAPAASAAPAPTDPAVVEVLDKLEARGKQIQTLTAKLSYNKLNTLTQDEQLRLGDLAYVAAAADRPARFAVHFNQLVVDSAVRPQQRDYIFDGTWLVEKDHDRHTFEKRQVVPPGEHFNPLQIDGPFPVPLGQKRADVLARYHVTQVPTTAQDAASLGLSEPPIHLHLLPREDAPVDRSRGRFTSIDMWFDPQSMLPVKVESVDRQGRTVVRLTNLEVNKQSAAAIQKQFDTAVPPPGSGWNVTVTPWQQ